MTFICYTILKYLGSGDFLMTIAKPENQNIEFKSTWRDEYLKWICAFANTEGGILYIGVEDTGKVIGVKDSHKLSEDIPNKIKDTMGLICDIKILHDGSLDYFQIKIEKYPFPVSYHGKYYKRSGSTMQEMSGIELDRMILRVQGRTWDSVPVPHVNVDDLENDAFRLFRKKALDSGRLDKDSLDVTNENLLHNLHVTEGEYLTRAAILAFHPDPEKWVTGAYIKVAYFENEADILYQDEIHGPLLLQVEKTMELIYTKYMKALVSYDGIYRKETFFFPKDAFRELLLNSVIHKDYLSTTPIQIRIYKDKIRLWNDGKLPEGVTVDSLYKEHISKPCNPNLANVFFKCGMIESWARGFEKITAFCEELNAKLPEIDLSLGGVTARCFASDAYLKLMKEHEETLQNAPLNVPLNVPLSEREEKILKLISSDANITVTEIANKLNVNEKTIKRDITALKEKNILEREGSKKSGVWVLK